MAGSFYPDLKISERSLVLYALGQSLQTSSSLYVTRLRHVYCRRVYIIYTAGQTSLAGKKIFWQKRGLLVVCTTSLRLHRRGEIDALGCPEDMKQVLLGVTAASFSFAGGVALWNAIVSHLARRRSAPRGSFPHCFAELHEQHMHHPGCMPAYAIRGVCGSMMKMTLKYMPLQAAERRSARSGVVGKRQDRDGHV